MTRISLRSETPGRLYVQVTGHCEHDVCVSVSALTTALLQYAVCFCDEYNGCRLNRKSYDYGNVRFDVEFDGENSKKDFLRGAEAVILGFELFANTYPKDVEFVEHLCCNAP